MCHNIKQMKNKCEAASLLGRVLSSNCEWQMSHKLFAQIERHSLPISMHAGAFIFLTN